MTPIELQDLILTRRPELNAVLARWKPADMLAAFDTADPHLGYHFVPPTVASALKDLEQQAGVAAVADYLGYVLAELMVRFEERFAASRLPPVFQAQFAEMFANIAARITGAESWQPHVRDDVFLKDLGICRLTLIPCVSHIVYPWSGMPRRVLFQQPLSVLPRAAAFFGLRSHGFKPFLEHHVHLPMRGNFSPEGRERFYVLTAQLLRWKPDAKGLMAGSWYFDPVVERISPRLAYLRQVPARHGALFLRGDFAPNPNTIGSALSKSQTRRQLYEQGAYMPTSYYMVWARRDILKAYG
jgi:hypothetical protein